MPESMKVKHPAEPAQSIRPVWLRMPSPAPSGNNMGSLMFGNFGFPNLSNRVLWRCFGAAEQVGHKGQVSLPAGAAQAHQAQDPTRLLFSPLQFITILLNTLCDWQLGASIMDQALLIRTTVQTQNKSIISISVPMHSISHLLPMLQEAPGWMCFPKFKFI